MIRRHSPKWRQPILWIGLFLFFAGCGLLDQDLKVKVEFINGKGIQEGDPVRFKGVDIGKVAEIQPTREGVEIGLSLQAKRSQAVQENARAMIVAEEQDRHVEVYNPVGAGAAIADGARLRGINSPLELAVWQAGGAMSALTDAVTETNKEAQDFFNSEEWKAEKERMRKDLDELSGQSQEFFSTLEKQFDDLIRQIEQKGGETSKQIEEDFIEIRREVLELSRELKRRGKDRMAETLDQFLDELQETMDQIQSNPSPKDHSGK